MKYNNLSTFKQKIGECVKLTVEEWLKFQACPQLKLLTSEPKDQCEPNQCK
jgi:hypothetical protein